jgi:polar amino acid transport system substrate-binding protein
MKRLVLLLSLGIIITSLLMASCSSSSSSEPTKIVVATDATWPHFESLNQQTKAIEGLDIDIMNAIAFRQNLQVEYKNVTWDPLLAGMAKGLYDAAISSIIITEERKKDMLFSDPYFAAGQIVVVSQNNNTITGKDSLSGPVGVKSGSVGDKEVKKIKAATPMPYDDIGLAFQDLMTGKVNAVVCNNPIALLYIGINPDKLKTAGKIFTDENYGIAVNKDKKDLLNKINSGLMTIKKAGMIELYSNKWLK